MNGRDRTRPKVGDIVEVDMREALAGRWVRHVVAAIQRQPVQDGRHAYFLVTSHPDSTSRHMWRLTDNGWRWPSRDE